MPAQQVFEMVSTALKAPARQARAESAPQVDVLAVAEKLASVASDNESFDAVMKDLTKLQKSALVKIANAFLGHERAYKTKADVLKAIRARQLQDAIEESRVRRI